jgi:hypothetical protein
MKAQGLWPQQEYVIQQARQAMKEHGWTTLPCNTALNRAGLSSLVNSIYRYHGNMRAFRKLLGQESLHGRWKDLNYTIKQAQEAMLKECWTTLPRKDVLEQKGYSSLGSAINSYHGGFPAFRKILGQEDERGRWRDPAYAIQQVQGMMKDEGWTILPSELVLRDKGYFKFITAINKYHGGFPAFRELLAKGQGQPTHKEQLERLLHNYVATPKDHIENVLTDYLRPA